MANCRAVGDSLGRRSVLAFAPSSTLYRCAGCGDGCKYFRMTESKRPEHRIEHGEWETYTWQSLDGEKTSYGWKRFWQRFCDACEQQNCVNDWENFSEPEKQKHGLQYYTLKKLFKRRIAKNKAKRLMGKFLKEAKNQIMHEDRPVPRQISKEEVLTRAKELK